MLNQKDNKDLKDKLIRWRNNFENVFEEHNNSEYLKFKNGYGCVSNNEIDLIVRKLPKTLEELEQLKGFGETKISKYGQDIIDIVNGFYEFKTEEQK